MMWEAASLSDNVMDISEGTKGGTWGQPAKLTEKSHDLNKNSRTEGDEAHPSM